MSDSVYEALCIGFCLITLISWAAQDFALRRRVKAYQEEFKRNHK